MSRLSKSLLQELIEVLVEHFGLREVQSAVEEASVGENKEVRVSYRKVGPQRPRPTGPTINSSLEQIRDTDPDKYRLLSDFLDRLRDRLVLPESEDIRYFAQLVGLKEIRGKSRKEMIPKLMRFLLDRDTETLRAAIQRANTISQQERARGFSVLTDKLLGKR